MVSNDATKHTTLYSKLMFTAHHTITVFQTHSVHLKDWL